MTYANLQRMSDTNTMYYQVLFENFMLAVSGGVKYPDQQFTHRFVTL